MPYINDTSDKHDTKRTLITNYFPSERFLSTGNGQSLLPTQPLVRNGSALPNDIQTNLVHLGMKIRKTVSEGYKQKGPFPSYANSYESQMSQATNASSFDSFNNFVTVPQTVNSFHWTKKELQEQRAQEIHNGLKFGANSKAKRTRSEYDTDTDEDTDVDDDIDKDSSATNRPLARTIATVKVFYVPSNSVCQSTAQEDFDDATFLQSRDEAMRD